MSAINLDREAARCGQAMATPYAGKREAAALDRVVTKALGVFQDAGVYAGLLFLYSRSDRELSYARTIRQELLGLLGSDALSSLGIAFTGDGGRWIDVATQLVGQDGLTTDLDKLLLVKELFEQALIYARYTAKAAAVEGGP